MLVKICGITNVADARYALDEGADWIGLNLVAGSRRIDLGTAKLILSQLDDPSRAVALVGLANDGITDSLLAALRRHGVQRLQLYGDHIPPAVSQLARQGLESIVVQPVVDEEALASLDVLLEACVQQRPTHVLFDAGGTGRLGGAGRLANWEVIAQARVQGRYAGWPPVILAGGLTPMNVAAAIEKLAPAGVDVSSGVEDGPGRKDHAKIRDFLAAARATTPLLPE